MCFPHRNHRRPSRCLCRRARQGTADHAERHPLRLAAGGSRPGPLWRLPAGRVRRRRLDPALMSASGGSSSLRAAINREREGKRHDDPSPRPPGEPLSRAGAAIVLPAAATSCWAWRAAACSSVLHGDPGLGDHEDRAPDASFIGRHAGGVLIYALSILDAYRIARIRYAQWSFQAPGSGGDRTDG